MKVCESPFHKHHRIPVIKEPEIEIKMFLILTKILQDTFEKIDEELKIVITEPSSFEYIKKALTQSNI